MIKWKNFAKFMAHILVLTIVVLLVLYCNNYRIALRKAGISAKANTLIDSGINSNGNQYRVLADRDDGMADIAYLERNRFGVWQVRMTNELVKTASTGIEFAWSNVAGGGYYGTTESYEHEFENHYFYCSDNAIKRIEFEEGDLPHNVTVSIYQTGNFYMLHFITFEKGEIFNNLDCYAILKENGCVE